MNDAVSVHDAPTSVTSRRTVRGGATRSPWPLLAVLATFDTVGTWALGLRIVPMGVVDLVTILASLGIAWMMSNQWLARSSLVRDSLMRVIEALAALIASGVVVGLASYVFAAVALATNAPLYDAVFLRADIAIGFDWQAWYTAVHALPVLADILRVAYLSFVPQLMFAAVILALHSDARPFLWKVILTSTLISACSAVLPAIGHHAEATWARALLALRGGALRDVDLRALEGLVNFPSFHAAGAVLLAAALWRVPVVRWIALALNAMMLVATVSEGGHYLIDVFAGVAVAALVSRVVGLRVHHELAPAR